MVHCPRRTLRFGQLGRDEDDRKRTEVHSRLHGIRRKEHPLPRADPCHWLAETLRLMHEREGRSENRRRGAARDLHNEPAAGTKAPTTGRRHRGRRSVKLRVSRRGGKLSVEGIDGFHG